MLLVAAALERSAVTSIKLGLTISRVYDWNDLLLCRNNWNDLEYRPL